MIVQLQLFIPEARLNYYAAATINRLDPASGNLQVLRASRTAYKIPFLKPASFPPSVNTKLYLVLI